MIIADSSAANGIDFYSRESANYHPKLTVVYSQPVNSGDTEAPSIPGNLQADSVSTSSVSLSWSASTDDVGVVGYKIVRVGEGVVGNSVTTSYTDTGLSAASNYSYQVIAFDAANNESDPSSPLDVTTDATVASIHVENIAMSTSLVGRKKMRAAALVSIRDDLGNAISNATIDGSWSGLTNQVVSDLTTSSGDVSFASGNVNTKTTGEFIFSVASVSAPGYSYDAADNVETTDCINTDNDPCGGGLSAPENLNASYDGFDVNLDWSAVAPADSYNVKRSESAGSGYVQIASTAATDYCPVLN